MRAADADGVHRRWLSVLLLLPRGQSERAVHVHVMKSGREAKYWIDPENRLRSQLRFQGRRTQDDQRDTRASPR